MRHGVSDRVAGVGSPALETPRRMGARATVPHLVAAGLAIALAVLACAAGTARARRVELRSVNALAPYMFQQKLVGRALQAAAFRKPDLLPVYGSSELDQGEWTHPRQLFGQYPTGFAIFPVGVGGTTTINFLENLAAVGDAVRGRKVVIVLSPQFYFNNLHGNPRGYARTFSRLQAYELAVSAPLSFGLRQAVARRLLAFPDTLTNDPVLKQILDSLADGRPRAQAVYYAVLPVAWLNLLALRLQDHWHTLAVIRDHADWRRRPVRQPTQLDWPALLERATQEDVAGGGPRGGAGKYVESAEEFLTIVRDADEWTDLDLLLRVLRELGARPLIFSMPLNAEFFDKRGITRTVRSVLYEKMEGAIAPYGVPFFGFFDHDGDRYFLKDNGGHPSRRGWIHYSEVLDRFYRDQLR
jgi:D-alanine transfer protein